MAKENDLIGVKAVADFLSISVRNVYNWEKKFGLPLHRVAGVSGHRIHAYKDELERWLKSKEKGQLKRNAKRIWIPVAVIVPLFLLSLFILFSQINNAEAIPATISADKNVVYLKDNAGKTLWQFTTKSNIEAEEFKHILDFKDVDQDSHKELIACTYDILTDKYFLTFFDSDIGVGWRKTISPELNFNGVRIDNLFRPSPVRFAREKSGRVVVISKWNHMERFLSIIASHDLDGNLLNTYYHTGHLTQTLELIDLDKDGIDEIVFTGTNNLLDGEGIVGALPLAGFEGISPPCRIEPEFSHIATRLKKYIADKITHGNQLFYLRFKKKGHLSKYEEYHNSTEIAYFSDDLIQIRLFPWRKSPDLEKFGFDYAFNMDFALREVLEQSLILNYYPSFLQNGVIDMPLERLKEIYSGIVQRWEDGCWVPVKIP